MSRLLILLAAVCFGTTGTAQALGAAGASPVTVGEARIVVGAIGLQLVARRAAGRGAPLAWPRTAQMWLAALGVAGYQVSFFLAVRTTGVALGTVVALGSAPVITGVLALACGQGRPGGRWAAATALAAVGLAVLTLGGGPGRVHPGGVLLALGAATCYATYTLAVKRSLELGGQAESIMAALFTGGALLLAPALLVLPVGWLATPRGAVAALWLGTVPTALAYLLFGRGLRGVSAAEASTLTLAEPLTAAALGVLALGEAPAATSLAGAALLLTGLVVLGVRRPRSRPWPGRGRGSGSRPEPWSRHDAGAGPDGARAAR